jgi:undecaprenyl-diphosphatase
VQRPETPPVLEVVRTGGRNLGAVRRFDDRVDAWFEPLRRNRFANRVFYLASEGADFSIGWHLVSAGRALARPEYEAAALRMAAALAVESGLVNGVLKQAVGRARPTPPEAPPHAIRRPKTSSFPSGHASSAVLAAALLSERSALKPLWWSTAAIVAASRIHTRMHHASDVVAGAAIGGALAVTVRRLVPLDLRFRPGWSPRSRPLPGRPAGPGRRGGDRSPRTLIRAAGR